MTENVPTALFRLLAALLAVTALAGACGGDDGGSTDQAATSSAAAVCDGEANETAPGIEPGTTPVAVYEDAGDGWTFQSWIGDLPESRDPIIPEDAGIVVCLEVTGSEVAEECEFEEEGQEFTLELADADYDVTVRGAATADELAAGSASATSGDCPTFTSFSGGETSRVQYARPVEEVVGLIEEAEAAA